MTKLSYTYEVKADAKGRLKIPTGLKKELEDVLKEGFIIKRSIFFQCLELYPQSVWDQEIAQINKLNRFVKKNVAFIRKFMAGVKPVQLDTNDRLLISKELLEFAGISKNIVLTPQINKVEIWDKETYESDLEKAGDMGALAEEVMGNLDQE